MKLGNSVFYLLYPEMYGISGATRDTNAVTKAIIDVTDDTINGTI
ncbi:hypothetical protein GPAL_3533 [Glaciecola pallidula DSM 14239 = ACAM 615]|uniref:Uncharacterized protein n=1 Tax=Brumicola pallidula DSM 14239 = ACAM 615 TaxID=1121922 RepID=K6YCC4_9ALTE|nr:hypothetical protein GPAL_3533 [Glaciecola pallidula DSM 14239 = ACAM 615]